MSEQRIWRIVVGYLNGLFWVAVLAFIVQFVIPQVHFAVSENLSDPDKPWDSLGTSLLTSPLRLVVVAAVVWLAYRLSRKEAVFVFVIYGFIVLSLFFSGQPTSLTVVMNYIEGALPGIGSLIPPLLVSMTYFPPYAVERVVSAVVKRRREGAGANRLLVVTIVCSALLLGVLVASLVYGPGIANSQLRRQQLIRLPANAEVGVIFGNQPSKRDGPYGFLLSYPHSKAEASADRPHADQLIIKPLAKASADSHEVCGDQTTDTGSRKTATNTYRRLPSGLEYATAIFSLNGSRRGPAGSNNHYVVCFSLKGFEYHLERLVYWPNTINEDYTLEAVVQAIAGGREFVYGCADPVAGVVFDYCTAADRAAYREVAGGPD